MTLSLGGADGVGGFMSDKHAKGFADKIYMFLGGSNNMRPFRDAILDGIGPDVEGGNSEGYAAFVDQIRARAKAFNATYVPSFTSFTRLVKFTTHVSYYIIAAHTNVPFPMPT